MKQYIHIACKPRRIFISLLVLAILMIIISFVTSQCNMIRQEYNPNWMLDMGSGLIVFSLSILVYLYIYRIKIWKDFQNIKGPSKLSLFISANIAWLLMIPGALLYYIYRGIRGDYPLEADSIGIPIMYQTIGIIILLIPLNIFIILSLRFYKSPSNIFLFTRNYNVMQIIVEIIFALLLLLNILILFFFIMDGDFVSIIVSLYFIYILMSLRTGIIIRDEK
ncbi:MAG: hypothetical protein LBL74_00325 [Bacteroidales bacterium]|nr:hypothetical protein [Bacteroidales bacterium]